MVIHEEFNNLNISLSNRNNKINSSQFSTALGMQPYDLKQKVSYN